MRKLLLIATVLFVGTLSGFAQQPSVPKVDFSYAFGTPHRITIGRPTNGNRTLLDLQPGNLRINYTYKDLSTLELNTFMPPYEHSWNWIFDIKPEIDGHPFQTSKWARMDGYLPALDNTYNDPHGNFHIEMIGGETATIGKIEVTNTDTVPHQYRLPCSNGRGTNYGWVDPGKWTSDCMFAAFQDRADRVLLLGFGADRWSESPDGKAVSAWTVTFIWDLKPGEKRTGYMVYPNKAYAADIPTLRKNDWAKEMETAKQEWQGLLGRMCPVSIPDKDVVNALKACYADLFIMREPTGNYISGVAGTRQYRSDGPFDTVLEPMAIELFGMHNEAVDQLRLNIESQGDDGDWADPKGWAHMLWSLAGFKSWAIMEHYQLTGDIEYLKRVYPHMLASSRFNENQRIRTRILQNGEHPLNYGLMPRGIGDCGLSGDGEDYFGVFIPHNIWSVFADSLTFKAAQILGKTDDVKELQQIYLTAKNDLLYTIDKGAINEGTYRWIPGKTGSSKGSRWAVLNVLHPCHLLSANHELFQGTLRKMEENLSKGGVPLNTGYMTDGSWVATTLDNIAENKLACGNGDAAVKYLYAALNHGTPLFTWCEERGPEPGTMKISGDLQHSLTPTAVVRVVRDMLVMEDGDGLNLALGTDRTWLASGKPVGVTDMPSHFGDVTYQMLYDPKKKTVTGEIKLVPKPNQAACKWTILHIRLPEGMKVKTVDKASKATILANGEGIRWEGQITSVKFEAKVK